jgi:AraC-like DNA-binding protein
MQEQRIAFSSAGPPGGVAAMQRWCDEYFDAHAGVEVVADWDSPATIINLRYLPLGPFALRVERADPIKRFCRRHDRIARDGDDHFTLVINRGRTATFRVTPSGSTTIGPGEAVLFDRSEVSSHICPGGSHRLVLIMPRRRLCEALPRVEDLVGTIIPPGNEALRLLSHYADGLLDQEDLDNPVVLAHAGQSLLDLAVLAFGTDRDGTEAARLRGPRAARLQAILRCIRADYADPAISPAAIARRVGVSTRTLHGLLEETKASFSERVRELRLAKAFELLRDEHGAARTVTDAAFDAGFSDLSHFNRSFKRKYGITPTTARSRSRQTPAQRQASA